MWLSFIICKQVTCYFDDLKEIKWKGTSYKTNINLNTYFERQRKILDRYPPQEYVINATCELKISYKKHLNVPPIHLQCMYFVMKYQHYYILQWNVQTTVIYESHIKKNIGYAVYTRKIHLQRLEKNQFSVWLTLT